MTTYAVNLTDLAAERQTKGPMCPIILLLRPVITQKIVICEKNRVDGRGLLFHDDLEPERVTAIVDIVRNGAGNVPGHHKNLFRIYQASKPDAKTWKRI
jgi:hypothetical protein